jgi:hypothetical protein
VKEREMKQGAIQHLAVAAFTLCFCPLLPAALITGLSFEQVDYFNNGSLSVPNSSFGEFDVNYTPDASGPQWLNVVQVSPTGAQQWVVQNHPLLSSSEVGPSPYSSTAYFDLGVPNGTNAVGSTFSYFYTVGSTPVTSAPLSGTAGTASIGSSQNIINAGVPSGDNTLNSPSNSIINWNVPFINLTTDFHTGMPNVVQELKWCGPGAAANSLQWLASANGFSTGQTLLQSQTELAANMMNNHTGNWDDKEVSGKLKYIKDHNLPLNVHYTGGVMLPTKGDFADPNGTGVNDGAITWDWIQSEMQKGEDLEFMTNTHWVVIESVISFDGIHLVEYRDDPFQKGAATTDAQKATIAGRHTWTYFTDAGLTNIGNGNEKLQAVVAESTPEPRSTALAVIALAFLWTSRVYRRIRARRISSR